MTGNATSLTESKISRAGCVEAICRDAAICKTNDCIIAATALEHHCQLLHNDKDFLPFAKHLPLKIVNT